MNIKIDWEKYAKNTLKGLKNKLKKEKGSLERDLLEKEIKRVKDKYAEYLK